MKFECNELVVLPPLSATVSAAGKLVLPEKFLDGLEAFANRWPGKVTAIVRVSFKRDNNLDHIEVDLQRYRFSIEPLPDSSDLLLRRFDQRNRCAVCIAKS